MVPQIFFRLLMVSLLNAHKLYKRRGGKSDFLQYIHDVAVTFLSNAPHLRNQPRRPPNNNLLRPTGRHFPEQIKYKGQNQKKKHGEKKCKVCCARGHKTKKTTWHCPDCSGQPGLYQGMDQNCFKIYHTQFDYSQ